MEVKGRIDVTSLQIKGALYCNTVTLAPRNDPENEPWPFRTHIKVTWSLCSIWAHGGNVSDRYVTHVSSYACSEGPRTVDKLLSWYRATRITTWIHVPESLLIATGQILPIFSGTRRFIILFRRAQYFMDSETDKPNLLYLFHILFNIIFTFTIWPPKRSVPPIPASHSLTQAQSHAVSSGTLQPVFCPHVIVQSQFQSHTKQQLSFLQQATGAPEVLNRNAAADTVWILQACNFCSLVWILSLFSEWNRPAISHNVPFDILKIQTLIKPSQSAQSNPCAGRTRRAVPIDVSVELSNSPTYEGTHITVPSPAMEAQRGSRGIALLFL